MEAYRTHLPYYQQGYVGRSIFTQSSTEWLQMRRSFMHILSRTANHSIRWRRARIAPTDHITCRYASKFDVLYVSRTAPVCMPPDLEPVKQRRIGISPHSYASKRTTDILGRKASVAKPTQMTMYLQAIQSHLAGIEHKIQPVCLHHALVCLQLKPIDAGNHRDQLTLAQRLVWSCCAFAPITASIPHVDVFFEACEVCRVLE